ncbi:hypothetical protein BMS3Abin16_01243 [archaeon BMS3Abin16]|nr:hypothetical protein BMS3Abin16_01243 [archaeon BMS3Abin16]
MNHRLAPDKREIDYAKGCLHLSVLVELVENDFSRSIGLQLDYNTHTIPIRLVAQIRNAFDLLVLHKISNEFDKPGFIHHIRQFRDQYALSLSPFLDFSLGAQGDLPAPCAVGFTDPASPQNKSACGEVRPRNSFHKLFNRCLRIGDNHVKRVHHFNEVMRRHVGCHSNSDSAGAV